MNAITSPNDLDEARAEMERMARAAMSPDGARGWWHAARMVRLFGNAARVMKQCAQCARFFADPVPEKAAAYREAMAVLERCTGESLAAYEAPVRERTFDFVDAMKDGGCTTKARSSATKKPKPKPRKRRGPGSIGWAGWEIREESAVGCGSSGGAFPSCRPSYRSRSSLDCPDFFSPASIPFIGG